MPVDAIYNIIASKTMYGSLIPIFLHLLRRHTSNPHLAVVPSEKNVGAMLLSSIGLSTIVNGGGFVFPSHTELI